VPWEKCGLRGVGGWILVTLWLTYYGMIVTYLDNRAAQIGAADGWWKLSRRDGSGWELLPWLLYMP
jgi:hypothetical protein